MTQTVTIFNGIFSIESPRGGHRTFKIKTQKPDALFAPGQRIVSLLNGPENESDYKKFGFVTDNGINVFTKMRHGPFPMYATMLRSLVTKGENSQFYKKGYRRLPVNFGIVTHPKYVLSDSPSWFEP